MINVDEYKRTVGSLLGKIYSLLIANYNDFGGRDVPRQMELGFLLMIDDANARVYEKIMTQGESVHDIVEASFIKIAVFAIRGILTLHGVYKDDSR